MIGTKKKTVWFNQGMALIAEVIQTVRGAVQDDLYLLASHTNKNFEARKHCDEFVVEPKGLEADAYVDWCLAFAVEHKVDLFVPSRYAELMADNAHRFAEHNIKLLLPGSGDMMRTIKHKGETYKAIGADACPMPEWRVVTDLAGLEAAYADLSQRHTVCFKPASGVFAHGFRMITTEGSAYERLMASGPYTAASVIGLEEMRLIFGNPEGFEPLMVLQYLEGRERSVDCIAHEGKLLRYIIRHKTTHDEQVIEGNEEVAEYIDNITRRLKLSGVFNIQFKDSNGKPYLLEINARMSGGLKKACLAADFALPYWAIKLALADVKAEDVPHPQYGATLKRVQTYEIRRPTDEQ